MTRTHDIVVIGAGIQGLSAAYNLALAGAKQILVIEAEGGPGRGSSGRSATMLMKSRENHLKIALSIYSFDRLMDFAEEFGERLRFRRTGFLSVVPPSQAARYQCFHEARLSMGVDSQRLTPAEIREIAPGLHAEDVEFGLLVPDDGEIDVHQLLNAYERRGRELGVDFDFECRATGLKLSSSSSARVETSTGQIECDYVVNAAGAEARTVASWVGMTLPITNALRSIFFGVCSDPDFQQGPMVEDAEVEWYYRPLDEGRVLVGMGKDEGGLPSDKPNVGFLPEVRVAVRHRAPGLADFRVAGGSSGIRPLTPDMLPIVGPSEVHPNFINLCGWGGEGIMHSPAGGALVAHWITGRSPVPVDIRALSPDRFRT